jgi:type IV secretory pathway VirB9-like protein
LHCFTYPVFATIRGSLFLRVLTFENVHRRREAGLKFKIIIFALFLTAFAVTAKAQSPVTTITLNPDQIGLVKTAQGITTRITFAQPVQEIVCGDLYDGQTGKGTFVVQRSGSNERPGNDVFIKPIVAKGKSNMFVKTGDNGKYTFNFDLEVVAVAQAHRVVNVLSSVPAEPEAGSEKPAEPDPAAVNAEIERRKAEIEKQARQDADEIIRKAQQQANRIVNEAEARVAENDRLAVSRNRQMIEDRFVQALVPGLREIKIEDPRATSKRIAVALDPRILIFDGKPFLRYSITNNSDAEFPFSGVSIEAGSARDSQPITIKVVQNKTQNRVGSGETVAGVVSFDAKYITTRDKLSFVVRSEDGSEVVRITIQ